MEKDIRDMKSGERQLFYRTHRIEILEYCEGHGFQDTLKKYNMTAEVLQKMLDRGDSYQGGRRSPMRGMSPTEKLLLRTEINEEAILNLRKEVADLKETFLKFQDEVSSQVASKFFKPLIEHLELSDGVAQGSSTSPGPEPADSLEPETAAPGSHAYDIMREAGEIVSDYNDDLEIQGWLLDGIRRAENEGRWYRAYQLLAQYYSRPVNCRFPLSDLKPGESLEDPDYDKKLTIWKKRSMDLIENE